MICLQDIDLISIEIRVLDMFSDFYDYGSFICSAFCILKMNFFSFPITCSLQFIVLHHLVPFIFIFVFALILRFLDIKSNVIELSCLIICPSKNECVEPLNPFGFYHICTQLIEQSMYILLSIIDNDNP